MTAGRRSALAVVPYEPAQVPRLWWFREHYPDVLVFAGPGFWQAMIHPGVIADEDRLQVITRTELRVVLDEVGLRLGVAG